MDQIIKRGDIYYFDFGENRGSIQSGNRPVLVLQADNFNTKAPTIIVAAITTVIKKQYLPSHVVLPDDTGLKQPSMVLIEQIRAVNKSDLTNKVGLAILLLILIQTQKESLIVLGRMLRPMPATNRTSAS